MKEDQGYAGLRIWEMSPDLPVWAHSSCPSPPAIYLGYSLPSTLQKESQLLQWVWKMHFPSQSHPKFLCAA